MHARVRQAKGDGRARGLFAHSNILSQHITQTHLPCHHELSPLTIARGLVLTQLEPGTAALAHVVTVHRACSVRWCHAVRAQTNIGVALAFVIADLPPGSASGYDTPR